MAFTRTRALRSLQSSLRHSGARATPRVSAPVRNHLVAGRRYASGGHGHGEPTSDIPWMIGAIVVTVPSCWFLWPTAHAAHGHDEHHEEAHEEKEEEAPAEEEEKEEAPKEEKKDEKKDEKSEEKSEDKEEKSEEKSEDKPEEKEEKKPKEGKVDSGNKRTTDKIDKDVKSQGGDTGAKHSTSPGEDKKSTKSDGSTDTAKKHGTVDSTAPPK